MKRLFIICMTVAVVLSFAVSGLANSNFTPSVTAKPAPELVPPASSEADVVAEIRKGTSTDSELVAQVKVGSVSIVPYADADEQSEEVKALLDYAYNAISSVESIGELNPDLDDVAKKIDEKYTAKDFVAKDLFDIQLADELLAMLDENEDYFLRLRFDLDIKPNIMPPTVIYLCDKESGWKIVDSKNVANNGDGTVTVDFYNLCPIVFLTTPEEHTIPVVDPDNPGTSEIEAVAIGAVAVVGAAAMVCLLLGKKKNSADCQ